MHDLFACGIYRPDRHHQGIHDHVFAPDHSGGRELHGERVGGGLSHQDEIPVDRTFREGFAHLAPRGLSYEGWCYHTQIVELTDLARAFRAGDYTPTLDWDAIREERDIDVAEDIDSGWTDLTPTLR